MPAIPSLRSCAMAGSATLMTVISTNTAPDPRIVPIRIQRGERCRVALAGIRGYYTDFPQTLLGARPLQLIVGARERTIAEERHRIHERTRDVPDLLHHGFISVERFVARRVWLVIPHVTVDGRRAPCLNKLHGQQSVRQRAALDAGS